MNNYLDFAQNLAFQAGEIMLKHFHSNVAQRQKNDETIVTIADEQINDLVIKEVEKTFPEHSTLGEEASAKKHSEFAWICDPINGTVPYAKGIPAQSVEAMKLVVAYIKSKPELKTYTMDEIMKLETGEDYHSP